MLEARLLTKSRVAEDAGINLSTLSDLIAEPPRCRASTETASRLSAAMRCRPGTLFPELANYTANELPVVVAS